MNFFRRILFHNFGLKLLALAISFFLWGTYAAQPMAEAGYEVPIVFVNVPGGLTISSDTPSTVQLLVRGRAALIRRLGPANLGFTVDLARANPGETRIPLTSEMADVPYGTEVVRITPPELRLTLVATSAPPQKSGSSAVLR